MKTVYRQAGELIDYTPAAAVDAGDLVFRGSIVGQVTNGVAANEPGALRTTGVIRLTKASATVFATAGAAEVYFDTSTDLAVTDASKPLVGVAVGGGADGDTYVDVLMMPTPVAGVARVLRTRVTTAQVNAGLTLLPAVAGRKYRLHDVSLIAIGGNAATATSVDILGTQSASSVKLMDARVAGLTQNTLLRAGTATNGLILAGGASFATCDANTAITIGKTGSDLATATHIDVLLTYSIEA
jgi:predicted RecA/RadA family phage recombinase